MRYLLTDRRVVFFSSSFVWPGRKRHDNYCQNRQYRELISSKRQKAQSATYKSRKFPGNENQYIILINENIDSQTYYRSCKFRCFWERAL